MCIYIILLDFSYIYIYSNIFILSCIMLYITTARACVSVCVCYFSFTGVVNHRTQHLATRYYTLMGVFLAYWLNHMWFSLLSYVLRHRFPRPLTPGERRMPLKKMSLAQLTRGEKGTLCMRMSDSYSRVCFCTRMRIHI